MKCTNISWGILSRRGGISLERLINNVFLITKPERKERKSSSHK